MRLKWLGVVAWFCLFNALLFKGTTFWYREISGAPATAVAGAYRLLANGVHWPYLALLFVGLLSALVILVRPRRSWVMTAAIAGAVAGLSVLALDAVVYDQYRMHLGMYILGLVFGGAAGDIFAFSPSMLASVALAVAVAGAAEFWLFRACEHLAGSRHARALSKPVWTAWGIGLLAVNLWHAVADARQDVAIGEEASLLPFYYPLTAKRQLYRLEWVARKPDLAAAQKVRGLRYPLKPADCRPVSATNVLLIVVDTWRADQLNAETMPFLAGYADRSHVFSQHVSASNCTRFGIFSLFYGLPGSYWQAVLRGAVPPVLMQEFQRQGFETAIYASAALVHPEFDRTVFSGVPDVRLHTAGASASARDRQITGDMVAFLERRSKSGGTRPFFGFLFYDAAHAYDVPDDAPRPFQPHWEQINHLALNGSFDRTPYFNRYRNAVRFIDTQIEKVLETLAEQGLDDDTLVIVTGDHGEEFNDTGKNYWGHNGNFSPWQLRVPLIVRGGRWTPGRSHYLTSHYDLAPTLLRDVLGCRNDPADYGIGVPLDRTEGRRDFVPVFDYNDAGIYQTDRITVLSRFGGTPVYNGQYDRLGEPADPALLATYFADLQRFAH